MPDPSAMLGPPLAHRQGRYAVIRVGDEWRLMHVSNITAYQGPALRERSHGRYAVIRVGDEYRLMYGEQTIGRFESLETAAGVADKLCRAVAGVGFDVELTVQTWAGELRTEQIRTPLPQSRRLQWCA